MTQPTTNDPTSKLLNTTIGEWYPEDANFWQEHGQRIATRNLWISIPCLLLSFCVWMLFSTVAVNLNKVGFQSLFKILCKCLSSEVTVKAVTSEERHLHKILNRL